MRVFFVYIFIFILSFSYSNYIYANSNLIDFNLDSLMNYDDSLTLNKEKLFKDSIDLINKKNQILKQSRSMYNLGLENLKNSKFDIAIENFTSAIDLDSSFSDAFFYRALCYENYDISAAIHNYTISFSLDSSNLEPLFKIANLQMKDDLVIAKKTYLNIIELDNKSYKGYYKLGVLEFLLDNYEEAINLFTLSIDIKKDSRAYNDRASCYRMLLRYDDAIKDYLSSIKIDPSNAYVHNNLASCYKKK